MAKATLNKNTLFYQETGRTFMGGKVVNCYIWGMARYDAETYLETEESGAADKRTCFRRST